MPAAKVHNPKTDPVLQRFRTALEAIYGERLERIVLFGSRARGDAGPDSDYDVAVFLKDLSDWRAEQRCITAVSSEIFDSTGEDIQAIPAAAGSYAERTPLMHEIRVDGIDIGPPGPPLSLYSPPPRGAVLDMAEMSPETSLYMAKARRLLREARAVLALDFYEQAGRIAYAAVFNAAQALIFERGQRPVKTHRGVKARFNELTRNDSAIGPDLRQFLDDGFALKRLADYPQLGDPEVSEDDAEKALDIANRFIGAVASVLPPEAG
jgi:uncharacterized protein (UPF0332 family)